MAKTKTAKKEKPAEKPEAAPEFKYGVKDLAEELDIKETSVRVQLRNKGIEKAGKSYGWNSKAELKEVVAQLRSSSKDEDDDEDEAPKKKAKKAAKPEKSKPAKKADKPAKKAKTKKARDEEDEDEDDD